MEFVMMDYQVQRAYVRTDNWAISAKVSRSETAGVWSVVKVIEISAGGLLFETDTPYKKDDLLWFDLQIDSMMPGVQELEVKVKSQIKTVREPRGDIRAFGVAFLEMPETTRIQLDELVLLTISKYKLGADLDNSWPGIANAD